MRIFYALVIALVAACATEPYEQTDLDVRADTAFANDKVAFDFFVAKGLTNFQAAGIVGNLDQESGVNPSSVQADGPGRGIAQWSVGGRWDTSANDNVKTYAAQQGESMTSLSLQLEFIWYELTTVGYGYSTLKATTNVTDATIAFMAKYEICGDCLSSQRVAYAQAVLAAYGQIPYGATYVSQSWPLASAPAMTVKCGESVAASIVLLNTGTDAWTSSTKLGTTMPRDRASIFAGSDWLAPNRAATSGAVAPGAKGTFAFSFTGPTGAACVPGPYTEYFGVVQEGVAWFSDSGDGGPADNDIEALIDLVPGDATGSGSGSASDGSGSDDTGSNGETQGSDDDPSQPGGQSAGCNASGNACGLIILAFAGLVRRRRQTRSK
jgi:Phage tail lysozyme